MRIEPTFENDPPFVIRDAFTGVMFETEEGQRLAVCMRDGAFEIQTLHRDKAGGSGWHRASFGGIVPFVDSQRHSGAGTAHGDPGSRTIGVDMGDPSGDRTVRGPTP